MIHCILGLGSNDGDREAHLRHALNYLADICRNFYCSSPYASPAIKGGKPVSSPHYLNSVAEVDFEGDVEALDSMLKAFEIREGRTPEARAEGKVPLDMDIVVADGVVLRPKDFGQYFFRRGYEELQSCVSSTPQK